MTSDEHVCPVCKQAVDTVVRRHKTLGVFVPLWGAGPCRTPQCARYEKAEAESERVPASEPEVPQATAGQGPADQASVERDS
ncbi:hypothetical protein ACWIID_33920 [Streptomyces phaeochromogenes]